MLFEQNGQERPLFIRHSLHRAVTTTYFSHLLPPPWQVKSSESMNSAITMIGNIIKNLNWEQGK